MTVKIENRKSYIFFEQEYNYYNKQNFTHEQIIIILDRLYTELNSRSGFHSKRNADAAYESLNHVYKIKMINKFNTHRALPLQR